MVQKGPSAASRTATDDHWSQARRIASELDKVLDGSAPRRSAIARVAAELQLSTRQIYNLLARYRDDRTVTVLLPKTGNTRRKRLPSKIEEIIAATLREQWLVLEAPPLAPVVAEIRARCEEAGLRPPSYIAAARRIPALFTPEEIAKGRSANPKHLRRLKPRPGYIHAPRPLDVCQIDHTPTDINFVEVVDGAGIFVGRAYLTILTDVFSRCILGFCLSLEKPSSLSVALCLAHAMCPKEQWMAARGLDHDWPMLGRPRRLVTDSAKEFKGRAFQRGCEEYGIGIRYRDRGRVHQGGVVERLLGKLNAVLATHPGSTGRSVADRDEYPSEKRACLSFADLERCVALAVVDHNLQENAKTLKVPLTEWQAHAVDNPRFNYDAHDVLLTFLPGAERRLTPQGISMFALFYYAPWLGSFVPERDRLGKLEIRYDPRDISHVYVRDPAGVAFRSVRRRDGILTPVTLWEHESDRANRRMANARSNVEKVQLRREIASVAGTAKHKKTELRNAVRAGHAAGASKPYEAMAPVPPAPVEHPVRQKRRLPIEEW
ncbi:MULTISPECIES: Mu transposase C-terminal domain-containing protein [unclassified Mesorhizobium]|uniref:Mu transposase C-terminal domain-containing protein n=1 Tax=unclassified Mesorhizobium TaxID=325217 RepID=UPI001FD9DBF5|nr:Mu transposase C-terminal domain-containing protein [Mesorhizobium sp. LSHC420B00]